VLFLLQPLPGNIATDTTAQSSNKAKREEFIWIGLNLTQPAKTSCGMNWPQGLPTLIKGSPKSAWLIWGKSKRRLRSWISTVFAVGRLPVTDLRRAQFV